jgi:hypothetical protein
MDVIYMEIVYLYSLQIPGNSLLEVGTYVDVTGDKSSAKLAFFFFYCKEE